MDGFLDALGDLVHGQVADAALYQTELADRHIGGKHAAQLNAMLLEQVAVLEFDGLQAFVAAQCRTDVLHLLGLDLAVLKDELVEGVVVLQALLQQPRLLVIEGDVVDGQASHLAVAVAQLCANFTQLFLRDEVALQVHVALLAAGVEQDHLLPLQRLHVAFQYIKLHSSSSFVNLI